MARRFESNQHILAAGFLDQRDGHYCILCHKSHKKDKLQIDHANNDPSDWTPENLHWMCQKHNLKLRLIPTDEKIALIRTHSAINESVRMRARGNFSTSYVKSTVDYKQGSPEMQVNALAENQWRDWIFNELKMFGFILKDVAIYTGAELFGVASSTTERYLKKLANPRSELVIERDDFGAKVIRFREKALYTIPPDDPGDIQDQAAEPVQDQAAEPVQDQAAEPVQDQEITPDWNEVFFGNGMSDL